jgi:hypothetical protein
LFFRDAVRGRFNKGGTTMNAAFARIGLPIAVMTLGTLLFGAAAQGGKTVEGKAEEFKGKSFDLKANDKAAITLTFPSGKEASVTVRSDKKTDIHLFVYNADKKLVAKDDSPGPSCDLTFTPKEAGPFTLEVRNLGPGENRSTLKVQIGLAK